MKRERVTVEHGYNYRIYFYDGLYFVDYFGVKTDGYTTLKAAQEIVYYHNN